jgi:hypothetical protein
VEKVALAQLVNIKEINKMKVVLKPEKVKMEDVK